MNRVDLSAQTRAKHASDSSGRGNTVSLNTGDPHADTPISGGFSVLPRAARGVRTGPRSEDEAFIVALEQSLEQDLQLMSPLLQDPSLQNRRRLVAEVN